MTRSDLGSVNKRVFPLWHQDHDETMTEFGLGRSQAGPRQTSRPLGLEDTPDCQVFPVFEVDGPAANPHFVGVSKTSLPPFCLLVKARSAELPNISTAVPSQQMGDRTDSPKLWDEASPIMQALSLWETDLGTEGPVSDEPPKLVFSDSLLSVCGFFRDSYLKGKREAVASLGHFGPSLGKCADFSVQVVYEPLVLPLVEEVRELKLTRNCEDYAIELTSIASLHLEELIYQTDAGVKQIINMHFQGFWLYLGLLVISANAEFMDDGVEMEDFEENSEEIDANEGELSSEIKYKTPQPIGEVYFTETFDSGRLTGWVLSKAKKDDTDVEISIYDGRWEIEELKENRVPGDRGLVLKSRAKHHAISAILAKPFSFADKPLIVQYEVNFQDGIDCGGAYIKLLADTDGLNLENFYDKTSYTIMFGPDKCGEDYKLHFIFRHKHPKTGVFEEKHAKPPDPPPMLTEGVKSYYFVIAMVMNPDDTFEVLIDQIVVNKGSLLEDVAPPINPPKEIEDPTSESEGHIDIRDESEPAQIEDSNAVKPDGWLDDEPKFIPDPNAEKPADWNEDMDGEWEAPRISNPACQIGCGEWRPPMIDNPKYKGVWRPPLIDNPNYQIRDEKYNLILSQVKMQNPKKWCYLARDLLSPVKNQSKDTPYMEALGWRGCPLTIMEVGRVDASPSQLPLSSQEDVTRREGLVSGNWKGFIEVLFESQINKWKEHQVEKLSSRKVMAETASSVWRAVHTST
ncbi:hypothetical protein MC885_020419 [Smutsia gigantea]|nr:hypothetical protein MC885_020419 [Smutsia gigantea]